LNGFLSWVKQLQFGSLLDTVLIVAASLVCIIFHETSHGRVAYWLGDDTAKRAGRLSLNPLRHIDPVGLVMMAVLKFGWAKPVPIDMRNFRRPKQGMALTALAGPVSNVLLSAVALLLRSALYYFYDRGASLGTVITFLEYVAVISAGLAVFNIIPVSPLDGSKVFAAVLPDEQYMKLMRYERYGMILLVVLMFSGVLNTPLTYLRGCLLDGLQAVTSFPYAVLAHFFG